MILALLSLAFWFILFLWISADLKQDSPTIEISDRISESVTVLVAMRDERKSITKLLDSLNNSKGFDRPLSVVLVDDSSSDESLVLAVDYSKGLTNIDLETVESMGEGKKQALVEGLREVHSSWLYLTDADCTVQPSTIRHMVDTCKRESSVSAFGSVLVERNDLFSGLQRHEHLNNQLVSQSLFAKNIPVLVNGANMIIHESKIPAFADSLDSTRISGDDVFFANSLEELERSFCNQAEAAVITSTAPSISAFWNQRLRWLSKQDGLGSNSLMFSAAVFSLSVLHIYVAISLLLFGQFVWLTIYLFLRFLTEVSFHSWWFNRLGQKLNFLDAFILSLIYPMYVVALAGVSLFRPNFRWKGRTHRA